MQYKDFIRYEDKLIESLEVACQGDPCYQQLKNFWRYGGPSERTGKERYYLAYAYAEVADLEAVARDPRVPRMEVESVLFATLLKDGIRFPKNFRPAPFFFEAAEPLQEIKTLEDARKGLELAKRIDGPLNGWEDPEQAGAFFRALMSVIGRASNNQAAPSDKTDGDPDAGIRNQMKIDNAINDPNNPWNLGMTNTGMPCSRGSWGCN